MPPPSSAALPTLLLSRYLFFLTHRPISRSNSHYLHRRIRGLQSLVHPLNDTGSPAVPGIRTLLLAMNPANLRETAERLQLRLLPLARTAPPASYICADAPPAPAFLRAGGRILVITGPAIGIGDEIICFPLPTWIKSVNPAAEVSVLSAYDGLWDRVANVDRVCCYRDHDDLLAAMRGAHELGKFDVTVLVDFENPELYQAIPAERGISRYAELSVGGRTMAAVDNVDGWIYRPPPEVGYRTNYYDAFRRLAVELGVWTPDVDRFDVLTARRPKPDDADLVVYVSPFTSKYDPSLRYWTRLLTTLVRRPVGRPVRFVLDPGTNLDTRGFAARLARSAAELAGADVRFVTAAPDTPQGLSLRGVFTELDAAHVALCADSFTAHAGPLLGCTTMVVAAPDLEDWRVPFARSFYFDGRSPIDTVADGMRLVLMRVGAVPAAEWDRPPVGEAERELRALGEVLERSLADVAAAGLEQLQEAHGRHAAAREGVLRRLADWPGPARGLLNDHGYDFPPPPARPERPLPPALERGVAAHIEREWQRWRNTNLSKYLELAPDGGRP